jgi:heme-degrading monooxygenase HmoA
VLQGAAWRNLLIAAVDQSTVAHSREGVPQMIAYIVRFKSGLSDEDVLKMYNARAPQYRALKGLIQKYYLRFPETGEHGAVYIWESEAALKEFRESELGRTISTAYQIKDASDVRTAEVVMTLRLN